MVRLNSPSKLMELINARAFPRICHPELSFPPEPVLSTVEGSGNLLLVIKQKRSRIHGFFFVTDLRVCHARHRAGISFLLFLSLELQDPHDAFINARFLDFAFFDRLDNDVENLRKFSPIFSIKRMMPSFWKTSMSLAPITGLNLQSLRTSAVF